MIRTVDAIEEGLVRAIAGETVGAGGDRVVRVYNYDQVTAEGRAAFVELNLSRIARDLERWLS